MTLDESFTEWINHRPAVSVDNERDAFLAGAEAGRAEERIENMAIMDEVVREWDAAGRPRSSPIHWPRKIREIIRRRIRARAENAEPEVERQLRSARPSLAPMKGES